MERGQQRPASNEGREESRQAQSALSTGSPSKSGVAGTKKSDASVRVLLTGRMTVQMTGETAETEVKTKEQQAQIDNDSTQLQGAREDEFNDASYPVGAQSHTARARMSPRLFGSTVRTP